MRDTYDPTRTKMTWGVLPISGYADGSMIQVNPIGDGVRGVTGTAGETAFIETPNRQHEVTFRLFETAQIINAALMALFNAGNLPAPVTIASLSTGKIFVSGAAKLERIPGTTYDNNVPVLEWKLIVLRGDTQSIP